jgi:hypothetical protein
MASHAKDQITRLVAMLGSIVLVVGVNAPCVWIGSFYIVRSSERVHSLAARDPIAAVAILTLTGLICGATFVKSYRVLWLWLGAVLLAAAIPLAWWHLNASLTASSNMLLSQNPNMRGFRMLWGWYVLAAGGLTQIGTAVWASFCALRTRALPAETAAPPA